MHRLRRAIIELCRETACEVDMLPEFEQELVDAWNAVCEASPTVGIPAPITDDDLWDD